MDDDPLVGLAALDGRGVLRHANRAFRGWWGLDDAEDGDVLGMVGLGRSVLDGLVSAGDRLVRHGVELPTGRVARLLVRRVDGGFVITAVDVTEERREADAARQGEERYRDLIDVGIDGVVLSIDGRIHLYNEAFASMLGFAMGELDGFEVADLTTPSSHGTIMEAIRSQDETPYEVVGLRKDGSTFPARIKGRNIQIQGQAGRLTAVADLSAEREAQRGLAERERRYRELAELLPVAVIEVDLDGRVTYANARAMRIFAWNQPMGASLEQLVAETERQALLAAMRGSTTGELIAFHRGDGHAFDARVFGAEMTRRARVCGMRAVVVPTEGLPGPQIPMRSFLDTRRMESLGALAGGLAHDFNNLLAAVRGNADLARRRLPDGHPAGPAVDAIVHASSQGAMVTAKLLASAGTKLLTLEPVQLGQVVEDTVEALWEAVEGKARLRLLIDPEVGWMQGASAQLSAVIVNLVLNAAEAVEPPGWVDLELRPLSEAEIRARSPEAEGEWVSLCVRDDGCGMSPETEARVFEPFFSTKFAGRGLGLSAVQGIVHSHSGFVRLESQLGRGTTVEVCFPIAPPPCSQPSPTLVTTPEPGRRAVVIADDEAPLRLMLRAMLEDLGFEVLEAEDGVRCLEVLRRRPDTVAVILDATMPRMGGAEVMRIMREEAIEVPVVLCSGFPSDIAVHEDRVPFRFLAKPFGLDELERTLWAMVGSA